jgi:hypothetical protein
MKPYINICLYSQTDSTLCAHKKYYDSDGKIIKQISFRYLVDHIYDIIFPIVEQYGATHTINVRMDGETLDISNLEQSYYEAMEDN